MGKKIGLVIALIVVVVAIVLSIYYLGNNNNQTQTNDLSNLTTEQLASLIDQVYEKSGLELPMLETSEISLTDTEMLSYQIGLTNTQGVKGVVMSMPLMNAQAFTFALIQTEKGADIEKIKKDVLDNSNPRKWVCVGTEKVMVTNSDTVVCLIMASTADTPVLANAFAEVTGNTLGTKLEKDGVL